MSGEALVLRPEPGNTRTAAALRRAGFAVRQLPLFAVRPLPWRAPDPHGYDALLLTSANAARHAGTELDGLRALPVIAVGQATAAAARAAGLRVASVGDGDGAGAVRMAPATARLLHLAGREHRSLPGVHAIPVYASDPLDVAVRDFGELDRPVALLHSARAGQRLAELAERDRVDRDGWTIAALSPAVAAAAGSGWGRVLVAATPDDAALVAVLSSRGSAA